VALFPFACIHADFTDAGIFFNTKVETDKFMTNYFEIVAAFIVALILTVMFSVVLRNKGPWGALWLVFVVVFLATWAATLWINPFGPLVLGVAVVPLTVVGLIFAFILAATTLPPATKISPNLAENTVIAAPAVHAIGIFFWILLSILVLAIAAGYYRMPMNTEQLIK
jgi:hypothetical protein